MKINSIDNKTNFGWSFKTHAAITGKVADEIPKLKKYKNTLIKFVQQPDFDERGFKGNNHFYFTPLMFRPKESFLDFFGKNNAGARFNEHVYYFDKLVKIDEPEAMEHAGRALHFLQDVTQPQHTERGSVWKKWKDLKLHKKFEIYVSEEQDTFIKNAKPAELLLETDEPDELFEEAVFLSENGKQVKKDRKQDWDEIAQTGISNAISLTKHFLEYVASKL